MLVVVGGWCNPARRCAWPKRFSLLETDHENSRWWRLMKLFYQLWQLLYYWSLTFDAAHQLVLAFIYSWLLQCHSLRGQRKLQSELHAAARLVTVGRSILWYPVRQRVNKNCNNGIQMCSWCLSTAQYISLVFVYHMTLLLDVSSHAQLVLAILSFCLPKRISGTVFHLTSMAFTLVEDNLLVVFGCFAEPTRRRSYWEYFIVTVPYKIGWLIDTYSSQIIKY